jgi:hypothetical protein
MCAYLSVSYSFSVIDISSIGLDDIHLFLPPSKGPSTSLATFTEAQFLLATAVAAVCQYRCQEGWKPSEELTLDPIILTTAIPYLAQRLSTQFLGEEPRSLSLYPEHSPHLAVLSIEARKRTSYSADSPSSTWPTPTPGSLPFWLS